MMRLATAACPDVTGTTSGRPRRASGSRHSGTSHSELRVERIRVKVGRSDAMKFDELRRAISQFESRPPRAYPHVSRLNRQQTAGLIQATTSAATSRSCSPCCGRRAPTAPRDASGAEHRHAREGPDDRQRQSSSRDRASCVYGSRLRSPFALPRAAYEASDSAAPCSASSAVRIQSRALSRRKP